MTTPGEAGAVPEPDDGSRHGRHAYVGEDAPAHPGTSGVPADGDVTAVAGRPHGAGRADDRDEQEGQPPLRALLEAVLLVTDEPVPAVTLAQVVERPTDEVVAALTALAAEYVAQSRGFELRTAAGGWRLYTRADCAPWVERFVLDGQQARLTQAALETLAVIAYRQPVTRARVSAVRGVNVDGVVRTLVARGLITEQGADPETGGTMYVTTPLLLEKLGLTSCADLPSLAPLLPQLSNMEEG